MANHSDPSFSDFPEDVQLCILSFLTPAEISTFACTSKKFGSLCRNDSSSLWYSMCDRKWGFKTQINKWGDGKIGFNLLYKMLSEYENLIGFWRRSGGNSGEGGISGDAPLVFFEWGDSCVIGSRVTPCKDGSYNVIKSPFIWMSLSSDGQPLNYLKNAPQKDSNPGMDVIQANVNFMGKGFVVLEESNWNCGKSGSSPDANSNGYKSFDNVVMGSSEMEIGSPPDQIMSDMYQHYANRRSPGAGGVRAWRRQRRREKQRQVRKTLEPEYLVKLECSPTRTRPLQGLWKGICDDTTLDFYQVVYDDLGGVVCARVRDSANPSSGFTPLFWTQNASFIESPLSPEEDYVYNTRVHIRPIAETEYDSSENAPSRIMYVNSSWNVGGRIWQYVDGTFGFGFFSNNSIVDMKFIAQDGLILDTAELCSD